jgi:hypothetical protein
LEKHELGRSPVCEDLLSAKIVVIGLKKIKLGSQ